MILFNIIGYLFLGDMVLGSYREIFNSNLSSMKIIRKEFECCEWTQGSTPYDTFECGDYIDVECQGIFEKLFEKGTIFNVALWEVSTFILVCQVIYRIIDLKPKRGSEFDNLIRSGTEVL